jgi:hypothetical protein
MDDEEGQQLLARVMAEVSGETGKFVGEFIGESDRAAVIIGVAKIDDLLRRLLQRVLLPASGKRDDFVEYEGPIGTLHSRIEMCFRMGLLDAAFARILHLLRKLRNDFAHEAAGVNLESGSHRDRLNEILIDFKDSQMFLGMKKVYPSGYPQHASDFRTVIAMLMFLLEVQIRIAEPLDVGTFKLAWLKDAQIKRS